jgi:hypothetical protein
MARVVLTLVLEVLLAVLLALVIGGLFLMLLGASPAEAFLSESPRLLFIFMDVGLVVWVVLLIVGAIRRKGLGWSIGGTILAAVIAALVNLIVVAVLAIAGGGADIFFIALGFEAGAIFVIAAAIATLLVRRVILR